MNSFCRFQFKTNHPAVTIIFKKDDKVVYNVDLAPVIEVKKWPENLTTGWEKRKKKGFVSHLTSICEFFT